MEGAVMILAILHMEVAVEGMEIRVVEEEVIHDLIQVHQVPPSLQVEEEVVVDIVMVVTVAQEGH